MNKQIKAYDCPLLGYDVLTDNLSINRASYFKGKSFPWTLRKPHITQSKTAYAGLFFWCKY